MMYLNSKEGEKMKRVNKPRIRKAEERLGFNFRFVHKDAEGNVIEDSGFLPNHMTDGGIEELYDVYFRGGSVPDNGFEIGLNTLALAQTSSFIELVEVAGTGYVRKAVTRDGTASGFPILALDVGNMQIETATVQFKNTGVSAWDGAVDGFLNSADSIDGETLVAFRPLSITRTLQPGDTLDVTIKVKGQQPV